MVRFGRGKHGIICARCKFSIVDQPQFEKDGKVYCKTCYTIISWRALYDKDEYRVKIREDKMVYLVMEGTKPIRAYTKRTDANAYLREYGHAIAELTISSIMLTE